MQWCITRAWCGTCSPQCHGWATLKDNWPVNVLLQQSLGTGLTWINCLSNALHSSIGHNIKSHPCPLSVVQYPFSGQSVKNFKWP